MKFLRWCWRSAEAAAHRILVAVCYTFWHATSLIGYIKIVFASSLILRIIAGYFGSSVLARYCFLLAILRILLRRVVPGYATVRVVGGAVVAL